MKTAIAIAVIACLASPAFGERVEMKTWSKSGISYEQYTSDTVDCAYVGYYRDISKDEAAMRFLAGFRAADIALNTPGGNGDSWGASVARTQPDRRKAEIQALQTMDVRNCLVERGYVEVSLTRSELKALKKLSKGSEARRRYLYAIAAR